MADLRSFSGAPYACARVREQAGCGAGLSCVDVVKKIRENQPQKRMENTHHRCHNLDGVFEIAPDINEGPVFSWWTMPSIPAGRLP